MANTLLKEGLIRIGLEVSEHQFDLLSAYLGLLLKWNKVYNLTAIRNEDDAVVKHLLDCAAFIKDFQDHTRHVSHVLDVGCGGGLPSVPLAILNPPISVVGIDAVGKKIAFLNQVAIELGLKNLKGTHERVEKFSGQFDIVTSRAFSSLQNFTDLTNHLLKNGGQWYAMKGEFPVDEVNALSSGICVSRVQSLDVPYLDGERHVLVLERH